MNKEIKKIWKKATLYVAFKKDEKGNKRDCPFSWYPKNGSASISDDVDSQETYVDVEAVKGQEAQNIQIKLRSDAIGLSRSGAIGWNGIVADKNKVRIKVGETWVTIEADGSVTQQIGEDVTYLDGLGGVSKRTEGVETSMSYDGLELRQETPERIAQITQDGFQEIRK